MPKVQVKNQRTMKDFTKKSGGETPMRASQNGAVEGDGSSDETDEVTVKQLLRSLQGSMTTMMEAMEKLTSRFDSDSARVTSLETRLAEAEERISAMEDELAPLRKKADASEKLVKDAWRRVDEQEARGRRNNIRVVGLPESNSMGALEILMERLVKAALPGIQLSDGFAIERAHRALVARPPPGAPPRAIIMRVLNYRDRELILRTARVQGEATFEGAKVSFYPDFTNEVQKLRRSFWDVKQLLRRKKVVYAMLYPAKLRVQHAGKVHFFTEPNAALDFIERHLQSSPRNGSLNNTPRSSTRSSPAARRDGEEVIVELTDSQFRNMNAMLDSND